MGDQLDGMEMFQSTLPVWGATRATTATSYSFAFQSTLPVWGATDETALFGAPNLFQSTLPVWGATSPWPVPASCLRCFNPRSPCGERRQARSSRRWLICFNPRSPCGERPSLGSTLYRLEWFQSTLPVWGATSIVAAQHIPVTGFNPRSPCGERPQRPQSRARSPRFQSTLPVWGATNIRESLSKLEYVSIHAPRVGSDCGTRDPVLA